MKLADHLSKSQKQKLDSLKSPKKKRKQQKRPQPKKEEKINWYEIMGSNNRGLVRGKGGAFKRR